MTLAIAAAEFYRRDFLFRAEAEAAKREMGFAKARFRKGRFRWDGTQWACLRPIEWRRPVREIAPRRYLGTSFRIGP